MAVRYTADGQDWNTTSSGVTAGPFTITAWHMIVTDRNAYSTVYCLDNNGSSLFLLQTDTDGVSVYAYSEPSESSGASITETVGTWYRTALVYSGTTMTLYHGAAGAALTSQATTGMGTVTGIARLRLGESVVGAEWLNGRMANVKLYNAALTATEIEHSLAQYSPMRNANMVRFWPLVNTESTDYSGFSGTLSGGSGSTTEAGPPIPWGPAPVFPI